MYSVNDIKDILIKEYNNGNKYTIVMPEGEEEKIQTVARLIVDQGISSALLLYKNRDNIPHDCGKRSNLNFMVIEEEAELLEEFANKFVEIRNNKVTIEEARKIVCEPNYFGVMLISTKKADCMLSGLRSTTADVIRPALQIIKTRTDVKIASSAVIMSKNDSSFIFADCSLNLDPNSEELASIAKSNVEFAKFCGVSDVETALLSYSSFGSGKGPSPDKVEAAVKLLEKEKDLYYGPVQFDAAVNRDVRTKKAPNLVCKKNMPDVFIFPHLDAGNIGYKILQRMGGYDAFGPFILGLNRPVNDLSRGASYDDIVGAAVITLYQAHMANNLKGN